MAGLNGFPLSDRIMVANLKLPTLGFLRLQAQEDVNSVANRQSAYFAIVREPPPVVGSQETLAERSRGRIRSPNPYSMGGFSVTVPTSEKTNRVPSSVRTSPSHP
jgi:hypothetical protein